MKNFSFSHRTRNLSSVKKLGRWIQISHIRIPGTEKIKKGHQAKQLVIENCKADLQEIQKTINDPKTGLKKQYYDLKAATPEEFPEKFQKLSEKIDKIEKEYLVCLSDLEAHSHLLADPKDASTMKGMINDLKEIQKIHQDLTQFKAIKDSTKQDFNPFMLLKTLQQIVDENHVFLPMFGKAISTMVTDHIRKNPDQGYEYSRQTLLEIANYCGVDNQQFIKNCGLPEKAERQVTDAESHQDAGDPFAATPIFEERAVDTPHPVASFFQDVLKRAESFADFFSESNWGSFFEFEEKPSAAQIQNSLENLKMASPTLARIAENKGDLEQVLKETVQTLERNLGTTIHGIQANRQEISSLISALASVRKELPNSSFLSSAESKLNELDASLMLRQQLLRLNEEMRAKSARVEEPIYSRPQSIRSPPLVEYSYKEPSHSKTASTLESLIKAKFNDEKLNKEYRKQFTECLNEIKNPPVPMTKAWCEQKINEMGLLSSLAQVEGTHQVRYHRDLFDNYKYQLQNQVSLFTEVERLESLFPQAKVEHANLEERANVLISRVLQSLASGTNQPLEKEAEQALNGIALTHLLNPQLVEKSLDVLHDLKLERQLLGSLEKIFPGVVSQTNANLEKTLDQIMHLEVPSDASLLPQFAENIQHARRQITNSGAHPANYSKVVVELKSKEQQIEAKLLGITDRTIKTQLEKIQNDEKTSLEEFQQLNLDAVKVITHALTSMPEENSAAGFSTRVALMQEVLTHFDTVPEMEKQLTELKAAIGNFTGTKEALEVLEGKKLIPEMAVADRKSDSFEIAQDVVTKKAMEQWGEYNQKLEEIKSGRLSQTASLELFREASIIADRINVTTAKLGAFIEDGEGLQKTVRDTHEQFQREFIEHTLNGLNLNPDQLIHNLTFLPTLLPGNLIVPKDAINGLINRTLENVREETALATLAKQRDLLQACVGRELGGQVTQQKLDLYNDLIQKLESFSKHPVENIEIIQSMLDHYPPGALNALGDQVNHLLISLGNNPGVTGQELQATDQLLRDIQAKLTRAEFAPLKQLASEIQENLEHIQGTIDQLNGLKSQFKAADSEDKLRVAVQFCRALILSEEPLSKFRAVSEKLVLEFSADIHDHLKLVKNSVRSEFQSYTATPLTQEESESLFERAHLYVETYTTLVNILGEGNEQLNKAKEKLEKFSSEVNEMQQSINEDIEDVNNRQTVLEGRLSELEEQLETLTIPAKLQEQVNQLADLYDAARDEKGYFPAGLSLPPDFDYSAPSASLLTHEPLKTSCERQIDLRQQELKNIGLDKREAEAEIAGLKKQEAKLNERFDIQASVGQLVQAYGLEEKGPYSQEHFENKYTEQLAAWESKQGLFSQAGAWVSKIGTSVQEIAGTITTGQTGKQAELGWLQSTYGQNPPDKLLQLASIIDTFSALRTQENKNQEAVAKIATQIQQQEILLEKLGASSEKEGIELRKLESLQQAMILGSTPYENGPSVIEAFEKQNNALKGHEIKIQTTQKRLEALSNEEKMVKNILEQSCVMGRWGSAKDSINAMHQFIQLLGKEGYSREQRSIYYDQVQKIRGECQKDPIFQKLLIPYQSQLMALNREFNR